MFSFKDTKLAYVAPPYTSSTVLNVRRPNTFYLVPSYTVSQEYFI